MKVTAYELATAVNPMYTIFGPVVTVTVPEVTFAVYPATEPTVNE